MRGQGVGGGEGGGESSSEMCPYTNTKKGIKRERDTAFPYDGHAEEVDASRPKGGERARFEEACKYCNIEAVKEMLDCGLVTDGGLVERCFYEACWRLAEARRNKDDDDDMIEDTWFRFRARTIRKLVKLVDMLAGHPTMKRDETPDLPEELWQTIGRYNRPIAIAKTFQLITPGCHSDLNWVQSVTFSPMGDVIASGSFPRLGEPTESTINLWSVETGILELSKKIDLLGNEPTVCVSFHPSGDVLASGSADGWVYLWNVKSGKWIKTLRGHSDYVHSVSFSPSGDIIASGSDDGTIKLWNFKTGKLIKTLKGHHSDGVYSVSFSPSGDVLASTGYDGYIMLWNVETGELIKTLKGGGFPGESVSFHPSGDVLAGTNSPADGMVRLWNVKTGELIKTLKGHSKPVHSVSFHPSGDVLASGSDDGTIILWNVETGELIKTHESCAGEVVSLSFHPSGDVLAAGQADSSIGIYVAL